MRTWTSWPTVSMAERPGDPQPLPAGAGNDVGTSAGHAGQLGQRRWQQRGPTAARDDRHRHRREPRCRARHRARTRRRRGHGLCHRPQHAARRRRLATSGSSRCPGSTACPARSTRRPTRSAAWRPRHRGALRSHAARTTWRRCSDAWRTRARPARPAGQQRLGRPRELRRRLRRAVLGASAGALGLDVRPRRAQPPAREPLRRADDGPRAGRADRHDDLLRPRPLPEGQPVLRPRQARDDPARVRHGRGAAPARRGLDRALAGLDADRVRPDRAPDRRGALARAAGARAHRVAALPGPRRRRAGRRSRR